VFTFNRFRFVVGAVGLIAGLVAVPSSCIRNDLPYPRIQPNFTSMVIDNSVGDALIDTINRTVAVALNEAADIRAVRIVDYSVGPEGARVVSDFPSELDLREPYVVTLGLYQDYDWTITATQSIERDFSVDGQIGAAEIDVPAHRVVAYIAEGADLSKVTVTAVKLGGSTAVMEPDLNGKVIDFTEPVAVDVTEFGRTVRWMLYVQPTDASVMMTGVDAWTKVAWVYVSAEASRNNGIEYRVAGSEIWMPVPQEWITVDGGRFVGRLVHLIPDTNYEVRAYSDEEYTAVNEFVTGSEIQVPNASLDQWWLDGKIWCPWAENGEPYWGTGNKGATTLGDSNSVPTDDTSSGTGYAAMLQSKFVGIAGVGKLASGNLFTGLYYATDGTNGILKFGRPFTQRPTKLRGYFKYKCADISHVGSGMLRDEWLGKPDTATVYVALTDWTEPYEIRTNPSKRQLFDPSSEAVIGYGALNCGKTVDDYIPFEINIDYRSTSRIPTHILIVASASKYGDYFTGGNGSVLCVDDFVLDYDY